MHNIDAGQPVKTRWDPMTYAPIFDDDIVALVDDTLARHQDLMDAVIRRARERAGL